MYMHITHRALTWMWWTGVVFLLYSWIFLANLSSPREGEDPGLKSERLLSKHSLAPSLMMLTMTTSLSYPAPTAGRRSIGWWWCRRRRWWRCGMVVAGIGLVTVVGLGGVAPQMNLKNPIILYIYIYIYMCTKRNLILKTPFQFTINH